jgi:PAS domain S-box-containing protein
MTLRTKISLHTAIIITLVLCIAGGLSVGFLKESLKNALSDGLRSSSIASSDAVARFLSDSLKEASAVAFNLPVEAVKERNAAAIEEKLKTLGEIFPQFDNGMFVLDPEGRFLTAYPNHPERRESDFSYREYFQRTKSEGRGVISVPYRSGRNDEPVITFTAPLMDSAKNLIGVLGCSARLLSANAMGIINRAKIGNSGYIYIFDKTRLMISHPDSGRVLQKDVPEGSNAMLDAAVEEGFTGVGETVNSRGVAMIASISKIPGTDWVLVAQQPKEEAYAPIRKAVRRILIGVVLAGLFSVPITTLIVRKMTNPLVKLREVAVGLGASVLKADGNWQEESQSLRGELRSIIRKDEIGDLAAAFTDMCGGLEETLLSLKEIAEGWEKTFESVPDSIFLIDKEYRMLRLNRAAQELTGKGAAEVIGGRCYEVMHGTGFPIQGCPYEETVSSGLMVSREIQDVPSGRFLKVITTPLLDKEGSVIGIVHVTRDITQRKLVEENLRQTKDMLHALVQSAPVAIAMIDTERRVLMWNPAAERIFGWTSEEVIGRLHPTASIGVQEDYPALIKAALDGSIVNDMATQLKRKNGSLIDVSLSAAPVHDHSGKVFGAMEILVDTTEKIRAEQEKDRLETQLRQAQKMEAIGTLAGGIAHDFNNILAAIIGYTELSLHQMPDGTRLRSNIEQVLKAGLRARDLVKQILTFGRKSETGKKTLELRPVIKEALTLLRASLPTTILIKEDLQENNNFVLADPTRIHQVIMNLCTNAAHSMREKGGVLEIGLSRIDASTAPHAEIDPGAYVRLTVKDTGHGMSRETIGRIFDPYFTTKDTGTGGTGLGLAVVDGIVKSYGGAIGVESEPGVGSRFDVFLPVVEQEVTTQSPLHEDHQGGNDHILFVDDEVAIVDMGRQILEHLGYRVTTRTSSIEALELFRANPERFDVVITDMTMPNMTGVELSSEIRRVRADIPIILCTGFSEIVTPEKANAMGIQEFVMKPLAMADMARTIRCALDWKNRTDISSKT